VSYSVDHPTWLEAISKGVNVVIALLCVLLVPYLLFTGSFWGAPPVGLVIQIFWICALPLLSMIYSARKSRHLAVAARHTAATLARFIPVLVFLVVGPALAILTRILGMRIMGL
jgi:hypothetical protein